LVNGRVKGQKLQINEVFFKPNNDETNRLLLWLPIYCGIAGAGIELLSWFLREFRGFCHRRSQAKSMSDWEAMSPKAADDEMSPTFSKEPAHWPSDEPPDDEVPPLAPKSEGPVDTLDALKSNGHITEEECVLARSMANGGDPKLLGALDSHERNMIKTGILIKKILNPKRSGANFGAPQEEHFMAV